MNFEHKIFIIGIAGASGGGKTHLADTVMKSLHDIGVSEVEIISSDNYYLKPPNGTDLAKHNWDKPDSLDLKLLCSNIKALKRGEIVEIPKYNFVRHEREKQPEKIIDGGKVKVVIVEGIFVLSDECIRSEFNLKLFTLLDQDICLGRRIERDTSERGRDHKSVIEQYQKYVKPAYHTYIEPTKVYADLIISSSEYTDTSIFIDVISTYVQKHI
jgi:uridine kinase